MNLEHRAPNGAERLNKSVRLVAVYVHVCCRVNQMHLVDGGTTPCLAESDYVNTFSVIFIHFLPNVYFDLHHIYASLVFPGVSGSLVGIYDPPTHAHAQQ